MFVNITWGAGGTTSGRSLELAELCQQQLGLTTCLHLTCTNMRKGVVDATLAAAKSIGVRNILALRGDPPRTHEYGLDDPAHGGVDDFVWAVDLVRYIRKEYGDHFCIGVAGYPEGHSDESNPASTDATNDMPRLVEKIEAGADFIMTQLFYDLPAFIRYEKMVQEWDNGAMGHIPIIPGLMPIQSYQVVKRTTRLCHVKLPQDVVKRLEAVRGNDEDVKKVGVNILGEIIKGIKATPSQRPRGFHFYTLNLEKAVSQIVERYSLIPPLVPADFTDGSAVDDSGSLSPLHANVRASSKTSSKGRKMSNRRPSSPHNHVMNDDSTATSDPPSRATTLAITQGVGSLGREATWDDFPNGRFGDARSPAFGEIDGYGPSIHMSPASARVKWGEPQSREDIGKLFTRHITGSLDRLPWSEEPLSSETNAVKEHLVRMIERGWWSIASQPAVDAMPSADPTFGWGPKGGFVFPKAFVEFFALAEDWRDVLRPKLRAAGEKGQVSWYASACTLPAGHELRGRRGQPDEEKETEVEFESSDSHESANVVTWGCFPGKEIVSPTIIEEISFRAWAEEAFNLWFVWERCYPHNSKSREVVSQCRQDCWLINVIGHGFKDADELWNIILDA